MYSVHYLLVVPVWSSGWRDRLFGSPKDSGSNTDHHSPWNPPAAVQDYDLFDYRHRDSQQRQNGQSAATGQDAKGAESSQCSINQVHMSSIPTGETKVDYFHGYMDGEYSGSIEECAEQCCKLGPDICQYAWIFTEKCFIIGCSPLNAWKCAPEAVHYSKLGPSIYASVAHSAEQGEEEGKSTTCNVIILLCPCSLVVLKMKLHCNNN